MTIPTVITSAEIAALEKALASGLLEVTFEANGVRHTNKYNTASDLLKAIAYARAAYAEGLTGTAKPTPSTLASFTRE